MTIVFFFCLFGTLQCAIFSLIVERNLGAWALHPGIEMIAIGFAVRNLEPWFRFANTTIFCPQKKVLWIKGH